MDKFLEQFKTAVEGIPEPVCPANAWSKFSAYQQAVAPPQPMTILPAPYFIAAASIITIFTSSLLHWFFEFPQFKDQNFNAIEVNCPCSEELIQLETLLQSDNFYTFFPQISQPEDNSLADLLSNDSLYSDPKSALKTSKLDRSSVASIVQKENNYGVKKASNSDSKQKLYGQEHLSSRAIDLKNQNLEQILGDSSEIRQVAPKLLSYLNSHKLAFNSKNVDFSPQNSLVDSFALEDFNGKKHRKYTLDFEISASTTLIQAEPNEPRVNNIMAGFILNLSKKFRLKTNLSLNYFRAKVSPNSSNLQNLNQIQRYRLKQTDIQGQSIQIITQVDYILAEWRSIKPFVGLGGGVNILESRELKYKFKSLGVNFFKHAREETEFTPFLISLQAGVDIRLHRNLDFGISLLHLRNLNDRNKNYLLSGLGLKYLF